MSSRDLHRGRFRIIQNFVLFPSDRFVDIANNYARPDIKVFSTLTEVIVRLRRLQNLVTKMHSRCLKAGQFYCISINAGAAWPKMNVVVLTDDFDAKRPRRTPDKLWCCFCFFSLVHSLRNPHRCLFRF